MDNPKMILKDKHIFLLEDDVTNLAIIRVALQKHGASVRFDNWGNYTIDKLLQTPLKIDLILLDIMLPGGKSGYSVYDQIKETVELKDIPVVAITASDSYTEAPKAKNKGFNGYISKPIDRNQLPKDLLTVIEGGEVWPD